MDKKILNYILKNLPYKKPFLFVDEITEVSENQIIGNYTFKENESFYKGHFVNNPITPGVIIIETMGQIGSVCFALYMSYPHPIVYKPILSVVEAEFYNPVYPKDKVIVVSKKIYFRNDTLKCKIEMFDVNNKALAITTSILKLVKK